MHRYEFQIDISAEEFLAYYRGTARHVIAEDRNGKTVQFPANLLQRYVTTTGVHGGFVLTCDDNHKVISLEKA